MHCLRSDRQGAHDAIRSVAMKRILRMRAVQLLRMEGRNCGRDDRIHPCIRACQWAFDAFAHARTHARTHAQCIIVRHEEEQKKRNNRHERFPRRHRPQY